ncbi:MAG: hypothetical protein ABIH18_00920 [Candidatus Omnitrophota bacterium]
MKIRSIFLGLAALLATYSFVFGQAVTEQLTLTTYYPSPVGSYSELQLVPMPLVAADCTGANDEGKMFYDITTNSMRVCRNVGGVFGWQDFGNWTISNDNTQLFANDTAWNVGIGTITPTARLDVSGNMRFSNNVFNHLLIDDNDDDARIRFVKAVSSEVAGQIMFDGRGAAHSVRSDIRFFTGDGTSLQERVKIPQGSDSTALEVKGDIEVAGNVFMGYEQVHTAQQEESATAECTGNRKVIGGGCFATGSGIMSYNYPPDDNKWKCGVFSGRVAAYAICANME